MNKTRIRLLGLALMLALSLTMSAVAPAEAAQKISSYILPGNNVFPEGVATQEDSPYFYVSSTSDGTIFRGNVKEAQTQVFLPGNTDGRTTAVGLKVDEKNRLFIAGGQTGKIFVYNTATRQLLFTASNQKSANATFINDVAVTEDGTAYFTDSVSPVLYRVSKNSAGQYRFEEFLNFTGTVVQYQAGFNLNGIAATPNGKYLIVVQSNTGKLFRIEIATKKVIEINLNGVTVTNGDGILLKGRTLYVVRNSNAIIVKLKLSGDLSSGKIVSETTNPSFKFPTTIAEKQGQLLVVNSQFDKRGPGLTPELPFTVSSIKKP